MKPRRHRQQPLRVTTNNRFFQTTAKVTMDQWLWDYHLRKLEHDRTYGDMVGVRE